MGAAFLSTSPNYRSARAVESCSAPSAGTGTRAMCSVSPVTRSIRRNRIATAAPIGYKARSQKSGEPLCRPFSPGNPSAYRQSKRNRNESPGRGIGDQGYTDGSKEEEQRRDAEEESSHGEVLNSRSYPCTSGVGNGYTSYGFPGPRQNALE